MRLLLITSCLLILSGCNHPAAVQTELTPSQKAIADLTRTTMQLEAVRQEKDYCVELWEDFETQAAEHPELFDPIKKAQQTLAFVDWREDLVVREQQLEREHAINVLIAHLRLNKQNKRADELELSASDYHIIAP